MEYVNLGNTGLRVSRVCLGMMSFGKHESRPWALDEDAAEPIVRRAVEGGITFFDTADVYNGGESEVVTGRAAAEALRHARGVRRRDEGARADDARRERARPLAQARPRVDRRVARSGSGSTTSTSTRSTAGIRARRSRRRWRRCTTSCKAGKARYIGASSMYAWQFAKAQSVATDARFVSMQNHYNLVYREEEREMIPQCIDQGVGVLPWSPLARGLLAGNRTREGERLTTRAKTDPFGDSLYTPEVDFAVVDRVGEVAAERGRPERAGRARLAAAQARRDGADRRRDEGRAPRGRARRRAALAQRGRDARLEEPYVPHAVSGH